MKIQAVETQTPVDSSVRQLVAGSCFHDAWAINAMEAELDPLSQFLRVAKSTPRWVDAAMNLRNRIVGLFGLKSLGEISEINRSKLATEYMPGDRVGIFTLLSMTETEVLLGDSDKHLDVVVSVHKKQSDPAALAVITVTTVVHVHNLLGRLYMVPVRLAQRIIVKAMVRAVGNPV